MNQTSKEETISFYFCKDCQTFRIGAARTKQPNLLTENSMELIKIICALILPPLGVFLQVGIGKHFWINILLTLLGYIPGIVHAVWVVAKNK